MDAEMVNWNNIGTVREDLKSLVDKIQESKIKEKLRQQGLEDLVRTSIIKGELKPKTGISINPVDIKTPVDFNQLETKNSELDIIDAVLGDKSTKGPDQVLGGGQFKPDSFNVGGMSFKKQPTEEEKIQLAKEKIETSPMYQENKAKRIEDITNTLEQNKIKKEMIIQAQTATDKIPTGLGGKMAMWWNKMFDPENPTMGEWQKVKMVLTDAQLMNTANTKGAISDREMELFSKAAANDDIASISAMKPVFNKLIKFINAEEQGKIKSFKNIYNEDITPWAGQAIEETNTEEITIPNTIKTTSQAVQYLMSNNGMSKDQAIEWIRSQ